MYNTVERPLHMLLRTPYITDLTLHILPIEDYAKCYTNAIIYIIEDGFPEQQQMTIFPSLSIFNYAVLS